MNKKVNTPTRLFHLKCFEFSISMSISRLEATLNNTQQSCFYIFHRLDLGKCYLFKQLLNNTKVK